LGSQFGDFIRYVDITVTTFSMSATAVWQGEDVDQGTLDQAKVLLQA